MPWNPVDKARVILHNAYTTNSRFASSYSNLNQLVQGQLDALTDENLITRVQADLTELDTLTTARGTEAGSANAALIKAGSLEWSEGSRLLGIDDRYAELRLRVSRILGQQIATESRNRDGMMLF